MSTQEEIHLKWDYTKHAKYYSYRPNYAPTTISMLVNAVRENSKSDKVKVADIGAGTANLSIMLLERGCEVVSVEPNDAMRSIGIERTQNNKDILWVKGVGENTTLNNQEFNWVTFGSSFCGTKRDEALCEAHRILKPHGYFSCMWNHRDLDDPIQKISEDIILDFVPQYSRGVRREDQRPILHAHKNLFDNIIYIEEDFYFHQTLENFINAWRSVKNMYWNLDTQEGKDLLEKIILKWREALPSEFDIKYTTRCWSARKI